MFILVSMIYVVEAPGTVQVPNVEGIQILRACWPHEGDAAELVRQLKYHRITTGVTTIADAMAMIAPDPITVSMLTWVPCTPQRHRVRGFDQSELLARALARRLRRRAVPCLRRLDSQPQTARSRQGRFNGPQLVHSPKRRSIHGQVLVVDDVCTTGSTLKTAATVLNAAGAKAIVAIVATVAATITRDSSGNSGNLS